MRVEIELIEDDFDLAIAQALGKRANTLALRVVELAIADECFRHGGPQATRARLFQPANPAVETPPSMVASLTMVSPRHLPLFRRALNVDFAQLLEVHLDR